MKAESPRVLVQRRSARGALTRASGFLQARGTHGFTHTLNPYAGCIYGRAGCPFCYVRQSMVQRFRAPRREDGSKAEWGHWVDIKDGVHGALARDLARERRAGREVRVYCGSVTDPYQPLEKKEQATRRCLEVFAACPPARLVVQTRSDLVTRDFDLLRAIGAEVNLTVETDLAAVAGRFTASAPTPQRRLLAAKELRERGVAVTITVSPLLPYSQPTSFAAQIAAAADRVVVDTLLAGDGAEGRRSRANGMPELLADAGYPGFMDDHRPATALMVALETRLPGRVGWSREGFTAS